MKTNFEYLNRQLKDYNKSDNFYRYLRDLEFLLLDIEKKIYLREFVSATYPIRMAWDLSRDLLLEIIKKSEKDEFKRWNENLKKIRKKSSNHAKKQVSNYRDRGPGFLKIWENYPTADGYNFQGLSRYEDPIKTFDTMNGWMHYRFDRNYREENVANNWKDKSTLFIHRDVVRYNEPTFDEVVNYLETVWYAIIDPMMKSGLFESLENYEFDFDGTIYDETKYTLMKFMQNKDIDDLVNGNKKCPICKKGYFIKPDFNSYGGRPCPFGAFLICDNNKCNAIVDKTLKVKQNIKNISPEEAHCPSCHADGSLQRRFSLVNQEEGIYKACNKCYYNDKHERNGRNIDSEINDLVKDYQIDIEDWY